MKEQISTDLSTAACIAVGVLVLATLAVLLWEARRTPERGVLVFVTGALATLGLGLAIVRPIRVSVKDLSIPPRIAVLVDGSLSMNLPDDGALRKRHRDAAIEGLTERARSSEHPARLELLEFGGGELRPFKTDADATQHQSLITQSIRALLERPSERPDRIVVVSDGPEDARTPSMPGGSPPIALDTISTTKRTPRDVSIRELSVSSSAIAHVALPLRVRIGCSDGLACDGLTVTVKEVVESGPPALLATGLARIAKEEAVLDLSVTLDQAGTRLLEVAVTSPDGDEIPENNVRYLPLAVTRERVRILHVAGRVSNDMRALRRWLKSDASVDVIAFFILRTPTDNPQAPDSDLALIPFPVDELFRDHLNSFDAVVLQDFDAQPYRLEQHLPALAAYVRRGGGLIMVGGPNSFVAGGYANTPLAGVLPVLLDGTPGATAADTSSVVPAWSEDGLSAPLLRDLRALSGTELPPMPGANVLGDLRPGALALWHHPTRVLPSGKKMPVLAIGDSGSGRSIALGVDGTWQLEFSAFGAKTGGRGFAALWDGLLGWLMRDPRYEPVQIELPLACVAGKPTDIEVRGAHDTSTEVSLEVSQIGSAKGSAVRAAQTGDGKFRIPPLPQGAYVARWKGTHGVARHFACEAGGEEWADTRPGNARLKDLAKQTGGIFRFWDEAITFPAPTVIQTEKHVAPLAPNWLLAVIAALLAGMHWLVRRRLGLR